MNVGFRVWHKRPKCYVRALQKLLDIEFEENEMDVSLCNVSEFLPEVELQRTADGTTAGKVDQSLKNQPDPSLKKWEDVRTK